MNKDKFCQITSNWDSHRPLLWHALEATKHLSLPVLELGAGYGSTPFLREYCTDNYLVLRSFDSNKEWAKKMDVAHCPEWDTMEWFYKQTYSVAFVDESPGEHRKIALNMFARYPEHAQIVVAHDTEHAADHGYKMRAELKKFKYLIDYETDGAWCTAVSNFIDVTKFEL
jgi:hypothetical protein